jgi:general L-amino acid transport system permease protein
LFVLLLLANVALGFFVPDSLAPSTSTRAIVVFTLFTAAYMAEIIRGGLQSVPRGQVEAAKAVGLSPARQTGYIVLPQALRNVIPAQIGQLISLFKDTTLAGIAMGLFELLNVSTAIPAQEEFRGQGLIGETITFAALMFWTVAFTMSRESQRLERRLGVGER